MRWLSTILAWCVRQIAAEAPSVTIGPLALRIDVPDEPALELRAEPRPEIIVHGADASVTIPVGFLAGLRLRLFLRRQHRADVRQARLALAERLTPKDVSDTTNT